ncbi:MAG TPA: sulfatase [Planctomycetota bacterium]|nr:sulfatase [Planctomycetota bacterium]
MKILAIVLAFVTGAIHAADATPPPNILFLIADDLSWHTTGYAGDPLVKTPRLDALAAEGVVFTHAAVTTSICMVSRASMLTGRWLSQMGAAKVTPETWPDTWPARLRAAGYFGGHIGKVHVKGQTAAGYDFWTGRNGPYAWMKDNLGEKIHTIDMDTRNALRFLQTRPKDRPFFLQVAYTVPHAEDADPKQYLPMPQDEPLYAGDRVTPPPTATDDHLRRLPPFLQRDSNESRVRWRKRFDTPEKYQEYTKNYYRLISGMDRSIGIILDELAKQGLAENTVVVFTGDNGYFLGEHELADKWYAYEESLRVPLIVRDPRLPAARRGQRCDELVLNVDLAPTFCTLAGVPVPAPMQGRELTPLLRGETPANWRRDFLYQFTWSAQNDIPGAEAVCSKDWKYIRWQENQTEELFDLRADPREEHNLSHDAVRTAELERLRSRLTELRQEVGGTPIDKIENMPFGDVPKAKPKP